MAATITGAGTAHAEAPHGSIVAWGTGQLDVPEPNADFTAISAGRDHSLGLKASGLIVAWGYNSYGQIDVPPPNNDFVAISAGFLHSLGLKVDGSIVAWGNNDAGQINVPEPNEDFIAIASGGFHSLGLKADGSIVAWGCESFNFHQCNVPAPNGGFTAVAAGLFHSLALRVDGSIVAWGNPGVQMTVPVNKSNFIAISAGDSHSCGLRYGSIEAWGFLANDPAYAPQPNGDYAAIASGGEYILGLKFNGSISGSGDNYHGQLNIPEPNTGFIAIAAGEFHGLAIRAATGACCDTYGEDRGCRDSVSLLDCSDPDDEWTGNAACDGVLCQCIPNCSGHECGDDGCGGICASCDDDLFCNGIEFCDSQGGCVDGTPPCDSETEECDEDSNECVLVSVPATSEWGLLTLTLLFLTWAKVAFGRKVAAATLPRRRRA